MIAEIDAIRSELKPSALYLACFDTRVYNVQTFTADDDLSAYQVRGGGGTDFRPIADHVIDASTFDADPPVAVIVLTDLAGRFPDSVPDLPWIWCSTSPGSKAPFGEIVEVLT
jgi:predicted metal-dependent peptidase